MSSPVSAAGGSAPTRRRGVLRRLLAHRSGAIGMALSALFVLMALFGPLIAPFDPAAPDYLNINAGIGDGHLLGTDNFGRDMYSRILVGARYSIGIGLSASLLSALVGGFWGLWSGYFGGIADQLSMRVVDILLAFPGLLLAIGFIAISGPGVVPVILASSLFGLPIFARLARASALSLKERVYIEGARSLGAGGWRIMTGHILPGMIAPVLVYLTLRTGITLLVASGLSFLGLGIQPPTPEWGAMLSEAQLYLSIHPLMAFAPGLAISLAILGFNLLGDGLRDVLDPSLSRE